MPVNKKNKWNLKGSFTVEASFIVPMILLLIMACMFAVFYYHDKNILLGAAYEASVVGSTMSREVNGVDADEVQSLAYERVQGKNIFLNHTQIDVETSEEELQVRVTASARKMRMSGEEKASITNPEKYIRDLRKIEGLVQ